MRTALRYLVLCNALLVALPPGWCCVLPMQPANLGAEPVECCTNSTTPRPKPIEPTRQRSCCHHADSSAQASIMPAAPVSDSLPTVPNCCCEFVPSVVPNVYSVDLHDGVGVPLAATINGLISAGQSLEIPCVFHPVSPPLHLQNCVWLC
jgi:hypothetical protein